MRSDVLAELLRRIEAKRPVVLATDLTTGEGRLLDPRVEGGEPDLGLLAAAREAAAHDRSERLERPGGPVFLGVYNPPVQVIIVGAVHVAQSLARMALETGYDVLVVDPRRAFATAERFRGVALSDEWPDEALARAGVGRRTAVVTMTHDPKIDDPALAAALRSEAFYIGALGSKKTQAARRERLRGMGFTDADLSRIHGPVGLAIGAVSTAEIAVSILSELIACLRDGPEAQRHA